MTKIPDSLFSGCSSLKNVQLHPNITEIGSSAFYCTGLTTFALPENCRFIGTHAFYGCSSLKNFDFGNVEAIEMYAFAQCIALEDIILSDNIVSIGSGAFYNCSAAEALYLGKSLKTLGQQAFINCKGIKTVYLPETVLSMSLTSSDLNLGPFSNTGIVCYTSAESVSSYCYAYFGSIICGYSFEDYVKEIERV